jgi:hypothetical protein
VQGIYPAAACGRRGGGWGAKGPPTDLTGYIIVFIFLLIVILGVDKIYFWNYYYIIKNIIM